MTWQHGDQIRTAIIKEAGLPTDAAVGTFDIHGENNISVDRASRNIWVTATTQDIDSDVEVVVPAGADPKSRFFTLGNVFIDHKYTADTIIGRKRRVLPIRNSMGEQTGWKLQFAVYPLTKNQYADDILTIGEAGGLTVSAGMQGYDFGKTTNAEKLKYRQDDVVPLSIVRTWNWLEESVTFMPANLRCRQIGYQEGFEPTPGVAKRMGIIDNLLCKGRVSKATAEVMGFAELTRPKRRGILLVNAA